MVASYYHLMNATIFHGYAIVKKINSLLLLRPLSQACLTSASVQVVCKSDQTCKNYSDMYTMLKCCFHHSMVTLIIRHHCQKLLVCLYRGLLLRAAVHPLVLGWSLNGTVLLDQADNQLEIATWLASKVSSDLLICDHIWEKPPLMHKDKIFQNM